MPRTVFNWKDLNPTLFQFKLKSGTTIKTIDVSHPNAPKDFLVSSPPMKTLWPKLPNENNKYEIDLHCDTEDQETVDFLHWVGLLENSLEMFMKRPENIKEITNKVLLDISPLRKDIIKRPVGKNGFDYPPYINFRNQQPCYLLDESGELCEGLTIERDDKVAVIFSINPWVRLKTDFGLKFNLVAAARLGKFEKSSSYDLVNVPNYQQVYKE